MADLKSIAKDPYSDMQVPFAVGSWCREHRLNSIAVDIRLSVARRNEISEQIIKLERERDCVETKIEALCQAVAHDKLGVAHV